MLSSLAMLGDDANDGYLTALDVLRLQLDVDLISLSACNTGRGRVVRGEGVLGLTRAFLFAGAPRVLCSLWKVDDAATSALMIKFYELWNPLPKAAGPERGRPGRVEGDRGLGAAAALQKAQAFIRAHPDHPEWKHPYYWAAWVLWGLPE
jgi:CHAT domain-containing protein